MTKKRVKNKAGTAAWNAVIEPFCAHAAENRGFLSRVAEKMTSDHKMRISPPQVQQWLARDRNVRIEPRAGAASILMAVCRELAPNVK